MSDDELKELLHDAKIVHLQPDDLIVLQLPLHQLLTPDVGQRLAEAFAPRHVVALTAGVSIGHIRGATADFVPWETV